MNEESVKLLEKAAHALEVAGHLISQNYYSDASSKLYYAIFYSAQALLHSEGIDVVKHSAVESKFGFDFVKAGKIDARYHKILIDARKIREIADYGIEEEIAKPDALQKLMEAREFLAEIKRLLKIQ